MKKYKMENVNDYRGQVKLITRLVTGEEIAYTISNDETLEEVTSEELVALGLKVEVPQEISLRQARELMIRRGMFDSVEATINGIEDSVQQAIVRNYLEYATKFYRDNALLIQLGTALGMTSDDLDNFFIEASVL